MTAIRVLNETARKAFSLVLDGVENPLTGKDCFLDAGALAEFIICFPQEPLMQDYAILLQDRAYDWVRSGLLENILVSSSEFEYGVSLLLSIAVRAPGFCSRDREAFDRLVCGGIVGRTELPLTWNAAVKAHFAAAGIATQSAKPTPRELANNLDKRALRRKTDSYDLNALITIAQLARLGLVDTADMPRRFAHILLLHAIHNDHLNWLPLAGLLGLDYYSVPAATVRRARSQAAQMIGDSVALLPGPPDAQKVDDRARISGQGVMIRSTLAYLCLVERDIRP